MDEDEDITETERMVQGSGEQLSQFPIKSTKSLVIRGTCGWPMSKQPVHIYRLYSTRSGKDSLVNISVSSDWIFIHIIQMKPK